MARRIATVRGVAIAPGVSKNGRLYTAELLTKAYQRASKRLANPTARPLTMFTHHDGAGKATHLVGRIAKLTQESDGSIRFRADIADTHHGRDIAALTATEDGEPAFLDGVSIRGRWVGQPRKVRLPDGGVAETADDLEIVGLDYTDRPGVTGARIESSTAATEDPAEADEQGLIFESVDQVLVEATRTPYGDVPYADLGYLPDSQKRFPLDTARRVHAAWFAIQEAETARPYTAQQIKRIRGRIRSAAQTYGVDVTTPFPPVPIAEDAAYEPVAECYDEGAAGFSISARNGPISVQISAYSGIEPAELEVIAKAAMAAACLALRSMDPDMDADIDVAGAPDADKDGSMESGQRPDDNQMESIPYALAGMPLTEQQRQAVAAAGLAPGKVVTAALVNQAIDALAQTTRTAPAAGAIPPAQEVPAVSEPQTPAVAEQAPAVAPTITLTSDQFAQLLARSTAPAPVAEAAPAAPVVETEDQRIARLVAEGVAAQRGQLMDELREEVRRSGPGRRGIRTVAPGGRAVSESDATHGGGTPSPEQIRADSNEALVQWVSNGRYTNYE